jgi:membrane carboxypeptidase/penicillin-binding protein PbpC
VVAAHGRVEWRVDEKVVGSTASEQTVYWPLAKGQHAVTARDGSGRTATATILVK